MSSYTTITLSSKSIAHNWKATSPGRPRAILILQHGFGEYAERYMTSHARLIPALVERNIEVWGLDLKGHGQSPGEKGRGVVNAEQAVRDHACLCQHVAGIYEGAKSTEGTTTTAKESTDDRPSPGAETKTSLRTNPPPIFLFGHSLGGLVTAGSATALLTPAYSYQPRSNSLDITGLILSSPVFPLPGLTLIQRLKATLIDILVRPLAFFFPRGEVPWGASPGGMLCGDEEQLKLAADDKMMFHGQISWTVAATAVGVVRGVWRGIRRGIWNSRGRGVEVFVFHGSGDCWADWRGSKSFVEEIRTSRGNEAVAEGLQESGARLVVVESPYHELLNSKGNEGQEMLKLLLEWIEEKIKIANTNC